MTLASDLADPPQGFGPPTAAPAGDAAGHTEALLRAIPLTRMVDCGLEVGAGQRLRAAAASGVDWVAACEVEYAAVEARRTGLSAVVGLPLHRQAVAALVIAQLAINGDDDRKRALYARLDAEVAEIAAQPAARCEVVAIPFRGSQLSGLLVHPPGGPARANVVLFGGLNGWGPAYWSAADVLAEHGLATLLVDLPGQGRTRITGGLFADHAAVTGAVATAVDWLEEGHPTSGRTGIWGNSFGGLFAALAAAQDDRLAACVVNGAPAAPTLPPFRTVRDLMFPVFGSTDVDTVNGVLDGLTFAGRGNRIAGRLLVLQGGADPLATAPDQRPFLDAGGDDARWVEWPDGEHTLYNHSVERNAVVAEFLVSALVR